MNDLFTRIRDEDLFQDLTHRGRNLDPANFGDRPRYILCDRPISADTQARIGPVIASLDALSDDQIRAAVFYVYFMCDSDALPAIQRLTALGATYVPQLFFEKTHYRFVSRIAYDALRKTWERPDLVSDSWISLYENICEAIALTRHIQGDYVEIGVFTGGSALAALNCLDIEAGLPSAQPRKAWLLDTFDGFNYDQARTSSDAIWADTHQLLGPEQTMAELHKTLSSVKTPYSLVQTNICEALLPTELNQIAVANIDVDMYEATIAALVKVAPLMAHGGIIIAEDPASTPGLYGALVALHEFLDSDAGKHFYCLYKGKQYFLINQPPQDIGLRNTIKAFARRRIARFSNRFR